jgi:hypothetical protein
MLTTTVSQVTWLMLTVTGKTLRQLAVVVTVSWSPRFVLTVVIVDLICQLTGSGYRKLENPLGSC